MEAGGLSAGSMRRSVRRRHPELGLFVLLFTSYAFFVQGGGAGQNSRFALVRAIVERGTFRIDAYHQRTFDKAFYGGHFYSDKAPGLGFAAAPVYWVVWPVLRFAMPDPSQEYWRELIGLYLCTVFTVSLASAAAGVAFYRILLRFTERPVHALIIALAYGLGTPAFAYSTLFMSHQFCAALLILCFYVILQIRDREAPHRRWRLGLAGFLASSAVISEFPAILIAAALAVYLAFMLRNRVEFEWFVFGGLGPLALLAVYNYVCFDGVLVSAYRYEVNPYFREQMATGFMGLHWPRPAALMEILVGSYRGLLTLSPFLIIGFAGLYWLSKRREWRREAVLCAAVVIVYLTFGASYFMWWGGAAMGPRHLVPMLPFLALPAAAALGKMKRIGPLLVGVSIAVVTLCTAVMPEFPDDEKRFRRPVTSMVLPFLAEGRVSEKAVLREGVLEFSSRNPGHDWDAFNLGEVLGLHGLASLIPLAVVWDALLPWLAAGAGVTGGGSSGRHLRAR